jgi:hypothetical protein
MPAPTEKLELALAAFRRDQALGYLRVLVEQPAGAARGRAFLCSDEAMEALGAAAASGEFPPALHAAWCAQLARAQAEASYAEARAESARLGAGSVRVDSDTRGVGELALDWSRERSSARRARLADGLAPHLAEHTSTLLAARARADAAAGRMLSRLAAPRHPDAGPEGGVAQAAEAWLAASDDIAGEAFQFVREAAHAEGEGALDTLWSAAGSALAGLVPAPGRYRRLAAELEPLGLRRVLTSAARLGPAHGQLSGAAQVAVVASPHDVRVLPARLELGLASELSAADALGRAAAFVHASPALPLALRHASAASVARAAGALSMLRFSEPAFLRRRRDLNSREAGEVARRSAAFLLLDARLAAAAALARNLAGPEAIERAQVLCERALLGPIPPGVGAFLLVRLSAGSAFRGKAWAPALAHALREEFDEDWYENPRAAEPLRGAFARAGELSVEAFAAELGAQIELGPRKLSELF